jgi:hypothetical protein
VVDVGDIDPVTGRLTFDGVAGARTASFPSVDIANGAPTGENAPNTIAMVWPDAMVRPDGSKGLNYEEALLQYSFDGGNEWTEPVNVAGQGERPNFPAVAISPDGTDVYVTYNNFLDPWQAKLGDARRFESVVRHADFGTDPQAFVEVHRGPVGDARGSSANSLVAEFLGDYNYVDATDTYGVAVWTDARNAAVCPDVNAYRAGLAGVGPSAPAPAPDTVCPDFFGDTDIHAFVALGSAETKTKASGSDTTQFVPIEGSDYLFLPLLTGPMQ